MPTYDYKCTKCGYDFELFQGMLENKLTDCPKCGGRLQRLIGAGAGIIFKGSGFYQTDYRSQEYRKRAKAERNPDGNDKQKSGGASNSKSSGPKAASAKESPNKASDKASDKASSKTA